VKQLACAHANTFPIPCPKHFQKLPRMNGMYWILVVNSTTLGETAGGFILQTLDFGYGGALKK
jgi:uncharacterized membrane-anchored protein